MPSIWRLDIRLDADNRVFVSGMGLESEWQARLRVQGTTATPEIAGNVELIRGTLGLAGRRFRLDRGQVTFTGDRPPNPQIDLAATSDIDGVEVGINVTGRSNNPQIAFTSSPGLPQDEIVSRILFGSSVTQISAIQAVQLAASLNSLRGARRRPQSARPAALGDRHRSPAPPRRRQRHRPRHRGRRRHVPFATTSMWRSSPTRRASPPPSSKSRCRGRFSLLSQFGSNSGTNVNIRYNRDY